MNTTVTQIDDALRLYEQRSFEFAELSEEEQRLEDERHAAKQDAIARIMTTNSGETNKQHSATSAEKIVNIDPAYAEYLKKQRHIVLAKNIAFGKMESARIRALALANMSAQLAEAA